ncbi:MAG: 3-phosphoshikimate 1-carboxyvinyltransferase, partial [Erysipelotrichia bacterium]|nr:3-phosphoshikimate 1-carboxyvinyltransferase [Erysipelotrichia bacterium]
TGNKLNATTIECDEVPAIIDELPALAVAMAFANGTSAVHGASELRNKETDRITNLISQFKKLGIKCSELEDGFIIEGPAIIDQNTHLDPHGDHRLAMAFSILGAKTKNGLFVENSDCIKISFPGFYDTLKQTLK